MHEWDYELPDVYLVGLMEFVLDNSHTEKFLHQVRLTEVATLTKEEHKMYEQSLMQKWDYKNGTDYAVEMAVREAEERAAERERLVIASTLIKKGYNLEDIQDATNLTIDRSKELEKQINSAKN